MIFRNVGIHLNTNNLLFLDCFTMKIRQYDVRNVGIHLNTNDLLFRDCFTMQIRQYDISKRLLKFTSRNVIILLKKCHQQHWCKNVKFRIYFNCSTHSISAHPKVAMILRDIRIYSRLNSRPPFSTFLYRMNSEYHDISFIDITVNIFLSVINFFSELAPLDETSSSRFCFLFLFQFARGLMPRSSCFPHS